MNTETKRIYLDTCAWCRLFDFQLDYKISSESKAVAQILRRVDIKEFEIIGGSVLLAEIAMVTPKPKEEAVMSIATHAASCFYPATESAGKKAREIMKKSGINAMDALHIAVALENNVEIFVTTDNSILNKSDHIMIKGMIIKNPCEVNMSESLEGSKDRIELMEKIHTILKRELSAEEYTIYLQKITPQMLDSTVQLRELNRKLRLEKVALEAKVMEKRMKIEKLKLKE
jgi:predicted nucleic acid-binding protein